jgi:hypothetical protein
VFDCHSRVFFRPQHSRATSFQAGKECSDPANED